MSLPKGQHFEYRVVWAWLNGHEFTNEALFDNAEDAERFLEVQKAKTTGFTPHQPRLERRAVGEWEAP